MPETFNEFDLYELAEEIGGLVMDGWGVFEIAWMLDIYPGDAMRVCMSVMQ